MTTAKYTTNTDTFIAAVIAAMLATVPVHAGDIEDKIEHWKKYKVFPPVEYDHPYEGNLQIFYVDAQTMQFVCPKTPYPVTLACAQVKF